MNYVIGKEEMLGDHSDVQMIFEDLAHSFAELNANQQSPKNVRRAFGSFIELSQKLTASMRKEYSKLTGKKWEASKFTGWNDVTSLFKELRNTDQHEWPIVIMVHERQYYKLDPSSESYLVVEGTWGLSDQQADQPPRGIKAVPVDIKTGQPTEVAMTPAKVEYEFLFYPRTDATKKLIEKIVTQNVHKLTQDTFLILKEYYEFYKKELKVQQINTLDG